MRHASPRVPVARTVALAVAPLVGAAVLAGCGADPSAAATDVPAGCAPDSEVVTDADGLRDALADAAPGAAVALAPGRYEGTFAATGSGTAEAPVRLCGGADAVLDGGSLDQGYTLHLDGASWWVVEGLTITGGKKGLMVTGGDDNVLRALTVHGTGDEAVHLRAGASRNELSGSTVYDTGLREPGFGEGVYVGTAESNWCDVSACEPDRSDDNVVRDNVVRATTAEAVDVKEGTTGGRLVGNTFEGPTGAEVDSLVDLKGNGWVVEGNTFAAAGPGDGVALQVQQVVPGWGAGNVVRGNGFAAGASPAVEVVGDARSADNVVACGQAASVEELSNVPCS